jgi:hypothetical protein
MEGIEPLPCIVVRRKAFPNAFSNGLAVVEQTPKDPKAIDELLSVVRHIIHKRWAMAFKWQKGLKPTPDQNAAETAAVPAAPVAYAAPPAPAATPPAASAAPVASPPPPSQTAKADAPASVVDESAGKMEEVLDIRLDTALLQRIDKAAKGQSIGRSAWLRIAAHNFLGDKI